MTQENERFSRRTFLLATGAGAAAGATGATPAVAQEDDEENGEEEEDEENGEEDEDEENGDDDGNGGDEEPDWPEQVEEAPNFDDTSDERGEDEVSVTVGGGDDGLQFDPPAIWIDEGATVVWEWSGEGGDHNVASSEGDHEFESDTTAEEGFTFEETFDDGGITAYECTPHAAQSMYGGIAVGDDIETVEVQDEDAGGGGGGVPLPDSARALGVATVVAAGSTLGLAYVFMKYGGDYEER